MCVVCGCGQAGPGGVGAAKELPGHGHAHDHRQDPVDEAGHAAAPVGPAHSRAPGGAGAARVSVPGMSAARAIRLEADILGANDRVARANRRHFEAHGVTALNLVSSPGSGKTTLLCATIRALRSQAPALSVAVIEGDQQTQLDAERIRATGAAAVQVNTGKGCHLDAPMVAEAFAQLHDSRHHPHHQNDQHHRQHEPGHGPDAAEARSLLFIENVGNLVCPALWDLGEAAKVVILSVTEGEDKPLKYPDMFAASALMVLNKIDLLPHLQFDVQGCIDAARRVNPAIEVIQLSASTGEGLADWLHWLQRQAGPQPGPEAAALRRVAELEAALADARRAAGLAQSGAPDARHGDG